MRGFGKRRKLTKAEVSLRSRAIIIESQGCADGPKPEQTPKPQKNPWADFDGELRRKIGKRELKITESGEIKRGG